MKFFELINSLNHEEIKILKKNFYTSNKSLNALWMEVFGMTSEEFSDKRVLIIKKVFGKTYSESTNKQLKNLLTELYHVLRDHVSQMWLENADSIELSKCINYLRQLGLRQANDLFEKEWNYYFSVFESNAYSLGLGKLYYEKFFHTIRNPKMYSDAIEYLKLSYKYHRMAYLEDMSDLRYSALNLNYLKEIYATEDVLTSQTFSMLKEEVDATFTNPLDMAFGLIEEEEEGRKWEIVQEISKLLIDKDRHFKKGVKFKLGQSIFNYAVVLLYGEKIAQAETIFKFIEQNDLIHHAVASPAVFYFNYSSLLLKRKKIEEAMFYQKLAKDNLKSVPIARKTLFMIRDKYLQILNRDYDNLYTDLCELQTQLFKEDQILYVRALIIMYLIDTGDLESAYRECENSRRMQYFNSDLARDESETIDFIGKLLGIQLKEKFNRTRFHNVKNELFSSGLWKNSSNLLKIWLKQYIERLELRFS